MNEETQTLRLFDIGTTLAEKVVERVGVLRTPRPRDDKNLVYHATMLFFFTKAYKTYQAVKVLWNAGFPEDALMLTRTIFELELQARYMYENPIERARRFTQHDPVLRYRYYEQLKALGDRQLTADADARKEDLLQLRAEHDECARDYPKGKGWWGHSIRWLADHLGSEMKKRYAAFYWMQSNLIHSNVVSCTNYMSADADSLRMRYRPSPPQDAMIVEEATLYFLDVMGHVADGLGLGLAPEIKGALLEMPGGNQP